MWVCLTSEGGETLTWSSCLHTKPGTWTRWIGSYPDDETNRNQMIPHVPFRRFLRSCCSFSMMGVQSFCIEQLYLSLSLWKQCLTVWKATSHWFIFILLSIISSHGVACFAFASLQLLFAMGLTVFMNITFCFLGLLSCPDVVQLWFIWVHCVPNLCAVNDQFPCIVIITSAVQMIFHLPLGTWFSAFCLQAEVHRLEIIIETNFDCFFFRLQTYLLG